MIVRSRGRDQRCPMFRNLRAISEVSRRVLVVEDNLDSVHSMALLVRMMGHEVQFAINGFAALEVARQFRPAGCEEFYSKPMDLVKLEALLQAG